MLIVFSVVMLVLDAAMFVALCEGAKMADEKMEEFETCK